MKEAKGGTVTVLTFGPARADTGLRECLARGADDAIRVASEGLGQVDALGVARLLAGVIKALPHDVVWMGNKGVGTDAQVLVPMLAELLDLPHVNLVTKLEWKDGAVLAYREIEGAREIVPVLLQQLTAPVRFTQAVLALRDLGARTFIEVGPGNVLSGLIRRIDKSLSSVSVSGPDDIARAQELIAGA